MVPALVKITTQEELYIFVKEYLVDGIISTEFTGDILVVKTEYTFGKKISREFKLTPNIKRDPVVVAMEKQVRKLEHDNKDKSRRIKFLEEELKKLKTEDKLFALPVDKIDYKGMYQHLYKSPEFAKFADSKANTEFKTIIEDYAKLVGTNMQNVLGGYVVDISTKASSEYIYFFTKVWQYFMELYTGYIPCIILGRRNYCGCNTISVKYICSMHGYIQLTPVTIMFKTTNLGKITLTSLLSYTHNCSPMKGDVLKIDVRSEDPIFFGYTNKKDVAVLSLEV